MTDNRTAPYAALLLRISLGALFLAHGLLKLLVFTPAGTVQFFGSLGYPAALAYFVIAAEMAGGLALILGLYARWVSVALLPILFGAALVHFPSGWLFSNQGGGWEFPVFWTLALVVQALLGDGVFALRPSPLPGGNSRAAAGFAR